MGQAEANDDFLREHKWKLIAGLVLSQVLAVYLVPLVRKEELVVRVVYAELIGLGLAPTIAACLIGGEKVIRVFGKLVKMSRGDGASK